MTPLALAAFLLLLQAPAPAAPAPQAVPEIAAEVERGVTAYNTQDIKYYETALAPDAVYIADDGAVFAGRERVVGLFEKGKDGFGRLTPPDKRIKPEFSIHPRDIGSARTGDLVIFGASPVADVRD